MLYERIVSDIKDAMKSKDTLKRDVLKQVQMKAQATAKDLKTTVIDDVMVMSAITKELKQLNQTKDSLKGKEDSELYLSTVQKEEILKGYLPEMMSEDECLSAVGEIMSANPDVIGGKLTGLIMSTMRGKADNKMIKSCIDALTK